MIELIIALAVALILAGFLGWRLWRTKQALRQAEGRCRSLHNERALRENLQNMLDSRNAEARRLRSRLHKLEDAMSDMEQQTSELNLNLFHESGLRILREKEEGARRMKLDLMERQLDEANDKLRKARQEGRENARRLNEVIDEQRARIDQLNATVTELQDQLDQKPQPRRSVRRSREGLPNQITLEDVL